MSRRGGSAAALAVAVALIAPVGAAAAVQAASATGASEPQVAEQLVPPSRAAGSYSARIVAPVTARSRPGAGRVIAPLGPATSWSHQPQALLVLRSAALAGREWLRVLLPTRPSGTAGWIPRDRVALRANDVWVEIRKGSRQLVAFRGGRRVWAVRAVIGTAATPTPGGLAAVYERNRQPDPKGFLGPWALPLTAHSPVLRSFGGGPGRIAIHGRDGASLADPLGSAASHGCIRVPNRGVRWLARHAPPGTPVLITAG